MTAIHYLFFGLGGGLGAVFRAYIGKAIDTKFPWSTFIVNLVGSFLIGIIIKIFSQPSFSGLDEKWLAEGFCGGFTTFSSFSYQVLRQLQSGKKALALLNILLSLIFCILGVGLGLAV